VTVNAAGRDVPIPRARGFTLLELLVVVSVSIVLVAMLAGLYRMVGRTAVTLANAKGEWGAEQFLRRQYLVVHPATLALDLFRGHKDALGFVSYRSARHGENGPPVLVRYEYEPSRKRLVYRERDLPPWWGEDARLSLRQRLDAPDAWWEDTAFYQVDGVDFRYLDSITNTLRWREQWEDKTSLPPVIQLDITRLGERKAVVLETEVLSFFMPSGY